MPPRRPHLLPPHSRHLPLAVKVQLGARARRNDKDVLQAVSSQSFLSSSSSATAPSIICDRAEELREWRSHEVDGLQRGAIEQPDRGTVGAPPEDGGVGSERRREG